MLVLFFLSGVCGLIYEIVWTRMFTVVIGNTVFSVSVVLSVFMAGLALGSRLAGRFVDRTQMPLPRLYAVLEAGIGVFNLLLPLLLKAAAPLFGAMYVFGYQSPFVLGLARVATAFALLIIPATLLGATLPVLIRFYSDAGRVYAINTIGAAIGAAAAGLFLIPRGGILLTLYLAAGLNFIIAIVAWKIQEGTRAKPFAPALPGPRIVLVVMFLSGFAALVDEVAWTRVLALIAGPTTYAFTFMLCSMIAGLGIGAAIGSRWARRPETTKLSTFAWIQAGVSWTSLALIPAFGRLPLGIASLVRRYSESVATIQTVEFLIFFGLMLAPTVCLGMTFPIASKIYVKSDSSLGNEATAIYAANTIGGIIGSLAAGFVLIPKLGSQSTLMSAAMLSAITGILSMSRRRIPVALCALAIVAVFFIPRWNPDLMSSGPYRYATLYGAGTDIESMLTSGDLLYFKEGAATTVSVRKYRGSTALAVDGKVDATDAGDMTTQKMLAHLPLLISKDPKKVAIIGLGSGVTAASALQHPIERLDVIEISPEVVEASGRFTHVNHSPLSDPRVELIVGDGRNHLRYTDRRYDVIISEPSNPWMSGMASLFTREFFEESRAKLTNGGIHCQWFHSYNMSLEDIKTVIATFRSVFPHALFWTLNEYDLFLLGSGSPLTINDDLFERNLERVRTDLAEIKIEDSWTILSSLMLRDGQLDQFSYGATLNTDNLPVLEFRAPLSIYANTTERNVAALAAAGGEPKAMAASAESHRHKGEALLAAESFNSALKEFRAAVALDPMDANAWKGIAETARGANRAAIETLFETALQAHPINVVRLAAADFYAQPGQYPKAVAALDAILATEPDNIEALEKLADAEAEQGSNRLAETAERLLKIDPENAIGLYHLAAIRLSQSRFDEAIQSAKRSAERDPKSGRTRNVLAIAYERTFQPQLADAEFVRALRDSPDDWVAHNNYGIFLLGRNRASDAMQQFESAIKLNPESVQGFLGMSEASRRIGNTREADEWEQKARRMGK